MVDLANACTATRSVVSTTTGVSRNNNKRSFHFLGAHLVSRQNQSSLTKQAQGSKIADTKSVLLEPKINEQ